MRRVGPGEWLLPMPGRRTELVSIQVFQAEKPLQWAQWGRFPSPVGTLLEDPCGCQKVGRAGLRNGVQGLRLQVLKGMGYFIIQPTEGYGIVDIEGGFGVIPSFEIIIKNLTQIIKKRKKPRRTSSMDKYFFNLEKI